MSAQKVTRLTFEALGAPDQARVPESDVDGVCRYSGMGEKLDDALLDVIIHMLPADHPGHVADPPPAPDDL